LKYQKKMNKEDEYHNANQAETLDKFRRVLMEVFNGDAEAMLSDIEHRAAEKEDYETAAQMRDLSNKINESINE